VNGRVPSLWRDELAFKKHQICIRRKQNFHRYGRVSVLVLFTRSIVENIGLQVEFNLYQLSLESAGQAFTDEVIGKFSSMMDARLVSHQLWNL
jgi:hypothetical protein